MDNLSIPADEIKIMAPPAEITWTFPEHPGIRLITPNPIDPMTLNRIGAQIIDVSHRHMAQMPKPEFPPKVEKRSWWRRLFYAMPPKPWPVPPK